MNIGLTGGIACGKSAVSSILKRYGAIVIDADQIAREVVVPGSPGLAGVVAQFGQAVLAEDGSLNRKKLGQIVFADSTARKQLELILHPRIRELLLSRMDEAQKRFPQQLVVVVIPLLYESDYAEYFEQVVVVYIPESLQLQRLMERDQLTREQALERIRAQMPIEQKRQYADYVIDNSGSLQETEQQINQFWHHWVHNGKGLP